MPKQQKVIQQYFCQFLDQLAVKEYRELPKKIGITKKMLTHIRNAPASATYDLTLKFAKALKLKPKELIDEYNLGAEKITVAEYKGLK